MCGPGYGSLGDHANGTGAGSDNGTGDDGGDGGDGTSDDGGTGSSGGGGTTGTGTASTTATQTTGTPAPPCDPIPLADIAAGIGGFVIDGDGGRSVSMAGDVNGDGLADVVVGAYAAAPNGSGSGRTYVVFGKADTDPLATADLAQGIGGFVLDGEGTGDNSGFSVSGAGDVNDDGLADVIVGAPQADGGDTAAGRSYVVFGKTDTDLVSLADVAQGTGGFAMGGEGDHDEAGYSVSGAGDVNDDGLADVIVGTGSSSSSQRAYVVFGKADTDLVELADVVQGIGGFALQNTLKTAAVSGAGDVNGDGLDDVLVGSETAEGGAPFSGRAYVVFGKQDTDMVALADVAQGTGGFVVDGESQYDEAGYSVSGAGDVNGDGLDDVIVGATQPHPDLAGVGRAYVVFGKEDTDAVSLADVRQGTGGFAMDGLEEWDYFGCAASEAGDLNGDGLDDIIVGTLWGTQVYVLFGKTDTDEVSLADVVQGIGGLVMEAEYDADEAGGTVGGGADVNGDGIPDLVVGARNAPRTYVIFGGFSCGGG
jgi:hypothetical protein